MKVKKIIKGMLGLGVVGGIAYAAYKLGECNGEINAKFREKYGTDYDEDEFTYDEPDDECIAPCEDGKK